MQRPGLSNSFGSPHRRKRVRKQTHPMTSNSSNSRFTSSTSNEDVRAELIARVRLQIAAGVYETEEKLEAALLNLFGEMHD
jgi:anti-sigma28 factor (negative regulator of flagellin synthesis)